MLDIYIYIYMGVSETPTRHSWDTGFDYDPIRSDHVLIRSANGLQKYLSLSYAALRSVQTLSRFI